MTPTLSSRYRPPGGTDDVEQTDATCSASASLKHFEFIISYQSTLAYIMCSVPQMAPECVEVDIPLNKENAATYRT